LTPVIIASWPQFSAAIVAAATTLGYATVTGENSTTAQEQQAVNLEIAQSEIVTGQLGRDQKISVTRGGVKVTFSRDARGKGSVCVTGEGYTDDELRAFGEELSRRVVQKYVHQKLLDEVRARGFNVVEEEVDENQAIRLKVRHWDN
jgi:hypothetical protein